MWDRVDPSIQAGPSLWTTVVLAGGASLVVVLLWSRWRRFDRTRAATVYLRGFQYLLSGDPDGAIEVLTKVASSGAVEAYFTLGSLYRRKGELERALQLHRNLLVSPGLDPAVRRKALGELGRDYRQGALWAQAAEALEQACDGGDEKGGAPVELALREELRDVYLAAGRYKEAAECQRTVWASTVGAAPGADRLGAHLWAEASQALLTAGDPAGALVAATAALEACGVSAHARFARAAVSAAGGDPAGARGEGLAAIEAEPWTSGLVLPWLGQAHRTPEARRELLAAIEAWLQGHPAEPHATLLRAQLLRADGRQREATAALRELLGHAPGFLEARQELGRIVLEVGLEGELRQQYQELLANLSADNAVGRCLRCQQPAREVSWRCPSCGAWDWLDPVGRK
jgi:lipopolysaccharide biosynthesis regulator YciM